MPNVFDLGEDHPLRAAHKKCSNHRADIARSQLCGCFYCRTTFAPERIVEWVDEDSTALCPECGIDSVLGGASGVQIDKFFLEAMRLAWFG
ncbi:cytoplasmic protein [Bradyrhizobium manausense]|uniref:cytoplasmic protein n=1 Tax=Bradyrhizobium manausense TaxID=989370 RepID=UPI001BAB903F|nr:cytoplasmic protein [Bradyrhizobium manausense]MBR0689189.1 cytoplasmic protein [Bradyrhizobium manausense]MBR0838107.1 cytoplasmic protein [Bradyrhizobium manausense]